MKKFYTSLLICILIIICIVPAYADGFGGGTRPGSFGNAGFGGSTIDSLLSYDALSMLCNDVNTRIASGEFTIGTSVGATIYFDSTNSKYVVAARVSGSWMYFKNPSGGTYYCPYKDGPSNIDGWLTSIYSEVDGIHDYVMAIYNVGYDIRATCNNINTNLNSAITKLSSIDGKLNSLTSLDTFVETTLNNNIVANGTAIATWCQAIIDKLGTSSTGILGMLNNINNNIKFSNDLGIGIHRVLSNGNDTGNVDRYLVGLKGYSNGITISYESAQQMIADLNLQYSGIVKCYMPDNGGSNYQEEGNFIYASLMHGSPGDNFYYIYLRSASNNAIGHTDSRLGYMYDQNYGVFKVSQESSNTTYDDSDILQALGDIFTVLEENGDICYISSTKNSNNVSYTNIDLPYSSLNGFITYLNTTFSGKTVRLYNQDSSTTGVSALSSTYREVPFMWARASANADIVTINIQVNDNGTAKTYTLCTASRAIPRFRLDQDRTTLAITNGLTAIENKVQSIYDWLDNADLLTNEDLQELLTEFENDIKDGDTKIKNGVKLFKATFGHTDDEYDLGDFNRCIQFMKDFWEGYENE